MLLKQLMKKAYTEKAVVIPLHYPLAITFIRTSADISLNPFSKQRTFIPNGNKGEKKKILLNNSILTIRFKTDNVSEKRNAIVLA